ncbi:hypothetical protein Csa_000992 [Cucumis sativus]|nr:hypothetical protein Csa_000992 [Cucumis sativus]
MRSETRTKIRNTRPYFQRDCPCGGHRSERRRERKKKMDWAWSEPAQFINGLKYWINAARATRTLIYQLFIN